MPKITTPVTGFTGEVAGVRFTDGEGETTNPAAIAYFHRQGYKVILTAAETKAAAKAAEEAEQARVAAEAAGKPGVVDAVTKDELVAAVLEALPKAEVAPLDPPTEPEPAPKAK
ncbi:hypothetical protein [Mycetocola saprophilus]|uniref:hypothetical protein n=1 Tax=Mycetocola saprophilus TaxID=76636 RepID=UPI0005B8D0F3|nr:hypothetical protein [Mycetocola saprophilus]